MTDSSWFLQVIRGEYVPDTLFGLERYETGMESTGMERTPSATSILRCCIRWSGTKGSGTESEDLIQSSGSGSGSGCALTLVADLSY